MCKFKPLDRHAPAAWRAVHVEGDYLYYDEFPDEFTPHQIRQTYLHPLYEVDAFHTEIFEAVNALQYAERNALSLHGDPVITRTLRLLHELQKKMVIAFDMSHPPGGDKKNANENSAG